MKAIVTGSGGLIGSECVRLLCQEGWDVVGVDNDMRRAFFGPAGTTRPVINHLVRTLRKYRHNELDVRDRQAIRDLFQRERPDFIIHTAAQPSHDKAASIPYEDFDVNARRGCAATSRASSQLVFSPQHRQSWHFRALLIQTWRQLLRRRLLCLRLLTGLTTLQTRKAHGWALPSLWPYWPNLPVSSTYPWRWR